jgi:hypothetical protein
VCRLGAVRRWAAVAPRFIRVRRRRRRRRGRGRFSQ